MALKRRKAGIRCSAWPSGLGVDHLQCRCHASVCVRNSVCVWQTTVTCVVGRGVGSGMKRHLHHAQCGSSLNVQVSGLLLSSAVIDISLSAY